MKASSRPSEQEVLQIVREIIERYIDLNDGEALPMLEVLLHENERIEYKMPDWLAEVNEVLDARYGSEEGGELIRQVLSAHIIGDDVVH